MGRYNMILQLKLEQLVQNHPGHGNHVSIRFVRFFKKWTDISKIVLLIVLKNTNIQRHLQYNYYIISACSANIQLCFLYYLLLKCGKFWKYTYPDTLTVLLL